MSNAEPVRPDLPFRKPPIVEAVIDVECDLPVGFDLAGLEKPGEDVLGSAFPKRKKQIRDTFHIRIEKDGPAKPDGNRDLTALQFLSEDEKEIVQFRLQGMAFNRLAPYSSFEPFLASFRGAWEKYVALVRPVALRAIRLRYINEIALPLVDGTLEFRDWLTIGPEIAEENRLKVQSFLNQCTTVDPATGRVVSTVLASKPAVGAEFRVILDLTVTGVVSAEPADWPLIATELAELRDLKNRVFLGSIRPACWRLFE